MSASSLPHLGLFVALTHLEGRGTVSNEETERKRLRGRGQQEETENRLTWGQEEETSSRLFFSTSSLFHLSLLFLANLRCLRCPISPWLLVMIWHLGYIRWVISYWLLVIMWHLIILIYNDILVSIFQFLSPPLSAVGMDPPSDYCPAVDTGWKGGPRNIKYKARRWRPSFLMIGFHREWGGMALWLPSGSCPGVFSRPDSVANSESSEGGGAKKHEI